MTAHNHKILFVVLIIISLIVYFSLSLLFFPKVYLTQSLPSPQPILSDVKLSATQIQLGNSFDISVTTKNQGEQADIHIVSLEFPNFTNTENVQIVGYNFTQSPIHIKVDDEVGSQYSGGENTVLAKYPSIESYSRPSHRNDTFQIIARVTPETKGPFLVYVKTVTLPHTNDVAHFPREGFLDYQDEFVKVFSMNVR